MITFIGTRGPEGAEVHVEGRGRFDGRSLRPRLDLANHSPTGFEWGYGGSGPAQLALAILAEVLGDDLALHHYQDFKWSVVAFLPYEGWRLTSDEVRLWAEKHGAVAPPGDRRGREVDAGGGR